jgi:hypothetical protein
MNTPGQLGLVLKAAWVVSAVATVLMALFITLMTALYFDMSYGQPADSYTGQDWDRAASWLMLTLSMTAIALAALISYIPARLRRLRARAHAANCSLRPWLGAQRPAFRFGILLSLNLPLTVLLVDVGVLITITNARLAPPPVWMPAGSLLAGTTAGVALSAAETWLLHRSRALDRTLSD